MISVFLAGWNMGESFDKALERESPVKKQEPEPTTAEKIKAFLHQMRARLNPPSPTPTPAYSSTFRLSKEEYALFNLISDLRMPVAMHTDLVLEWCESLRLGYMEYPFRLPDENLVTSISITPMFTYSRDWVKKNGSVVTNGGMEQESDRINQGRSYD